jgi:segregation and condensation protein B
MSRKDYPPPQDRFRILEAMIFVSPSPVRLRELAEATGWSEGMIERDLSQVAGRYLDHGLELQRVAGAYRLVTKAELSEHVERLIGVQNRRRLTRAQLETLSVVAYRQPVTRAQVEAYRGVNCERLLGQLSDMRLVREAGRAELPGRPLIYATTIDFLRYFGLESLDQLPDLGDLKRQPVEGISASQALWNASARGEAKWDEGPAEEPALQPAATPAPVAQPALQTMGPLAEEISGGEAAGGTTKSLRKLLDKIRGRSAAQQKKAARVEEAS